MNPLEKQPEDEVFTITFVDTPIDCHKRNTFLYEFNRQPEGDHIFIAQDIDEDDMVIGAFLWRLEVEKRHDRSTWNTIYSNLLDIGCRERRNEVMDETDIAAFQRYAGRLPVLQEVEIIEPEPIELTPRQDNKVNWLGYLLKNELITPPDFGTAGGVIL